MNKGNLRRAESKIRQYDKDEWGGCLTPSEALAILDDGARERYKKYSQREYLQSRKDKGDSEPTWFYFLASKAQQERWGHTRRHHATKD